MAKIINDPDGYDKAVLEIEDLINMEQDGEVMRVDDVDVIELSEDCRGKLDDIAGAGVSFGEFV